MVTQTVEKCDERGIGLHVLFIYLKLAFDSVIKVVDEMKTEVPEKYNW